MSQTNVNEQGLARVGQKYSLVNDTVLSYAAEGAIKMGRFCSLGTDKNEQVKLPALAASITSLFSKRGVALDSHARENIANGLDPQYEDKAMVSVMTKGQVYVECEAAVLVTDEVHVRQAVDGGLVELGIFAPATGVGLSALANARWLRASELVDGKHLAVLELL